MFRYSDAFGSLAVDDLEAARRFYAETLGMPVSSTSSRRPGTPAGGDDLLRIALGGGASVLVYAKPGHVPASFTILNFAVDDINAAVDALVARGVTFERYEGMSFDDRGIHRGDIHPVAPVAWFKDPAGNVLSLVERQVDGKYV